VQDLSETEEPVVAIVKMGSSGNVAGFGKEQVDQILDNVAAMLPVGTRRQDKLSLCWRNTIIFGDRPCAIVQHVSSHVAPGSRSIFEYEGWTVEAYPRGRLKYREIRVSPTPRSADWIVYTHDNLYSPETFYSVNAPGDELNKPPD
jgi:hypothetical protein